jgi:cutinase
MVRKHPMAVALWVVAVTSAALSVAPISPPSAAAQDCPDVEVVFARGTNDPVGAGPVGQAFTDSLRSKVGGRSVGLYAVNYAATMNFLRVADGVNDANNHVNFMIANCPATRLVLGGFSQGAAIIDLLVGASLGAGAIPGLGGIPGLDAVPTLDLGGVAPPLSPDAANHVAAVATFGNPIDKASGPLNGQAGVYGARTIDLCNAGDPICGPGNMNNMAAHHQYIPGGTDQAASFAAGLI